MQLIKKIYQHRCFPVEFVKFLRTPILKGNCERLFLKPAFSPGLPFLITYTSGSTWPLYFSFFIIKFRSPIPPFPIDTSVIRSSFLAMSFQNRCPTYFPAKYFPGLICRLGTRVSSISQILVQKSEAYFQPSQTCVMDIFSKNS